MFFIRLLQHCIKIISRFFGRRRKKVTQGEILEFQILLLSETVKNEKYL